MTATGLWSCSTITSRPSSRTRQNRMDIAGHLGFCQTQRHLVFDHTDLSTGCPVALNLIGSDRGLLFSPAFRREGRLVGSRWDCECLSAGASLPYVLRFD